MALDFGAGEYSGNHPLTPGDVKRNVLFHEYHM